MHGNAQRRQLSAKTHKYNEQPNGQTGRNKSQPKPRDNPTSLPCLEQRQRSTFRRRSIDYQEPKQALTKDGDGTGRTLRSSKWLETRVNVWQGSVQVHSPPVQRRRQLLLLRSPLLAVRVLPYIAMIRKLTARRHEKWPGISGRIKGMEHSRGH